MPLKMIAMDLDGTLLDQEKNIAPEDAAAVREAVAAGYYVTLATGRMYRSAQPYAQELGLTHPLVVYNGAFLKDPASGKVLGNWPLPLEVAQPLLDDCLERGIYIQAYVDDCLWAPRDCEEVRFYSHFARVPYEVEPEAIHALPQAPHKLLVISDRVKELRQELEQQYSGKIKIVSSSKGFLEITAPATNKWHALQVLAAREGIPEGEILCVGDSDNDLDMIAHAGLGVAMGNANEAVCRAARVVTAPNTRNGVARIIRSIMTRQVDVPV